MKCKSPEVSIKGGHRVMVSLIQQVLIGIRLCKAVAVSEGFSSLRLVNGLSLFHSGIIVIYETMI